MSEEFVYFEYHPSFSERRTVHPAYALMAVQEGARLLDSYFNGPHWCWSINIDCLDTSSFISDILGQLFDSTQVGCVLLFEPQKHKFPQNNIQKALMKEFKPVNNSISKMFENLPWAWYQYGFLNVLFGFSAPPRITQRPPIGTRHSITREQEELKSIERWYKMLDIWWIQEIEKRRESFTMFHAACHKVLNFLHVHVAVPHKHSVMRTIRGLESLFEAQLTPLDPPD